MKKAPKPEPPHIGGLQKFVRQECDVRFIVRGGEITVPCMTTDVRQRPRRDYQVTPIEGEGKAWVSGKNVTFRDSTLNVVDDDT